MQKILSWVFISFSLFFLVVFLWLGINFLFILHPFYKGCSDLSLGMQLDDVSKTMQNYIDDNLYKTIKNRSGNYGWLNRLAYDESLSLILNKNPWYSLGERNWTCSLLFKDGLLIDINMLFGQK